MQYLPLNLIIVFLSLQPIMANSSPSDADLWEKIVNDDYRAFTALFERHWYILYKTANKYIRDPDTCEELVHDLFLNIWNRRKYLNIADFKSYLKASTRYLVYNVLKKSENLSVVYLESYPEETKLTLENRGQENMIYHDLEKEMEDCLKQLPKRSCEIFLLSRKDHLTNNEIAERLGISKRSVENQITQALKHLRLHFKDIAIFIVCNAFFRR